MTSSLLGLLRRVFRFPVIARLWGYLLALAVYSAAVAVFERYYYDRSATGPPPRVAEVVLTSLLFGWLLQYRTLTAYDRWYEGRRLWGQLVNVSRNLVLKTVHVVRPPAEDAAEVRGLVREFAATLRARLGADVMPPGNAPVAAAGKLYAVLARWHAAGAVDTFQALAFDAELRQLMDVAGACERIKTTPLTASHRGLIRKGIAAYLVAVPWLVVGEMEYFTVVVTVLVGYVLLAVELVADDIEDPFGYGPDDLPLDAVVGTIDRSAAGYEAAD